MYYPTQKMFFVDHFDVTVFQIVIKKVEKSKTCVAVFIFLLFDFKSLRRRYNSARNIQYQVSNAFDGSTTRRRNTIHIIHIYYTHACVRISVLKTTCFDFINGQTERKNLPSFSLCTAKWNFAKHVLRLVQNIRVYLCTQWYERLYVFIIPRARTHTHTHTLTQIHTLTHVYELKLAFW